MAAETVNFVPFIPLCQFDFGFEQNTIFESNSNPILFVLAIKLLFFYFLLKVYSTGYLFFLRTCMCMDIDLFANSEKRVEKCQNRKLND